MDRIFTYLTEQNVIRYRDLLNSEIDPTRLAQLRKLLIEEEDKLGAAAERLEAIEREIAKGEERIEWQRALVASMEREGVTRLPPRQGLRVEVFEPKALAFRNAERVYEFR